MLGSASYFGEKRARASEKASKRSVSLMSFAVSSLEKRGKKTIFLLSLLPLIVTFNYYL